MRFRQIILAYFIIGAVMYGGGGINWDDAGLGQWFISNDDSGVGVEDNPTSELEGLGGAIQSVVDAFGGPLILIWNTIVGFVGYLHWPVVVLESNNAPPRLVILLGGGLVVGFYMSLIGLVRSSA